MTNIPPLLSSDFKTVPVGVSLKSAHYQDIVLDQPSVAFFEAHAENYMVAGGAHRRYLDHIAANYPLSLHGVGMSLGSAERLDRDHLERFKVLVDTYKPVLVSEHLAWSVNNGRYLNDLLPLPYTKESLLIVVDNVKQMQDAIGQGILLENPSSYMSFKSSIMQEVDFLCEVADQAKCGLLLDVNNVYVSACNLGFDAKTYLDAMPAGLVGEIHLAGHAERNIDGASVLIDDHGSVICDDVWDLYAYVINRIGVKPTLVEWDNDIPSLSILMGEANKALSVMEQALADHQTKSFAYA